MYYYVSKAFQINTNLQILVISYLQTLSKILSSEPLSAFNNKDCVKALNSINLQDRVSVMYNNKIKHSIFS